MTVADGSCPKVAMLAQPFLVKRFGPEQLGNTNLWHFAISTSNSGTYGIGKNRVASKTSKTITAWWLTANLKQMPLTSFPYTTQIWIAVRKLVPTSNFTASFSCSANSLLRTTFRPWKLAAVPKLRFLHSRFCRYLASDWPNNMHSSEEQSWYLDTTSSRVAPKLDCSEKAGAYLQLHSFTFLHSRLSIFAGSCSKAVILAQPFLV